MVPRFSASTEREPETPAERCRWNGLERLEPGTLKPPCLPPFLGIGQLGHGGREEVPGGVAGGSELRLKLVDEGHQLVHLGHDPALFGDGWDGYRELIYETQYEVLVSNPLSVIGRLLPDKRGVDQMFQVSTVEIALGELQERGSRKC